MAINLTPVAIGFNHPIGIDFHQPSGKVVMSVNYPNGMPYNFELVASDGTHTQFSAILGYTDEVKIATARDALGGFMPGELFTGTGVPGVIARISPDGSVVQPFWVTLPGENGLLRGGLHVDRTGVFGGDLIVVTTAGGVWRITSAGVPTQLARLDTHLEGVVTVPDDPAKYGPWSGRILAGAENQGRVYAIDAGGAFDFYELRINPEDIDIIPADENFFGVDFGGQAVQFAPASEFAGMVGDVLIAQELPGILWRVTWDGTNFQTEALAHVPQWEHVTFAPAVIEPPMFEYAAKLICGLQRDPDELRLTRGLYATAINVHNPQDEQVRFFKKLALTYPPDEQRPGKVLPIGFDELGPDDALEVDCVDIQRRFPELFEETRYIKGFVVIQSPASLDVTAVYTAAALDREGQVASQSGIDVEQIRERRKDRPAEPPDLIPVPDEMGSFCRRDETGLNLIVTVRNQGGSDAGASTTEVDFFQYGKISLPTGSLGVGTSTDLLFPIPLGCFDPNCEFRITVDVLNAVAESNEGNNSASGICIG
jgi:hypothetical protein